MSRITATLEPADNLVRIFANRLTITNTGSIVYSQLSTQYELPPDLSLYVAGMATIDGRIDLSGKSGDREGSGTSYNCCTGVNGGRLLSAFGGRGHATEGQCQ